MSNRERYTREMLMAVTAGGFLSMVLCLILPGVETKSDIFGCFFGFWVISTMTVWELFDLMERIKRYVDNKNEKFMER